MKIISCADWKPAGSISLDDRAIKSVRSNQNILITAGPGAGKTELLAQKADYLFRTNSCAYTKKILAISFKVDSAENLLKRVLERFKDADRRFVSQTFDAFAKNILDRFYSVLPYGLRLNRQYLVLLDDYSLLKLAFDKVNYTYPHYWSNKKLNLFLEKELLEHFATMQSEDKIFKVWQLLLNGFDGNQGALTFKMINRLAIAIIEKNSNIKRIFQFTYSHVFLDEFQDTTDMQYELLKACFSDAAVTITAVGDDKQRIMLWAGANKNIFTIFTKDFNAERISLNINYRSTQKLVELQSAMYSLLDVKGHIEEWQSSFEAEGCVDIYLHDTDEDEASFFTQEIISKINSGIKPQNICILCKQKPKEYTGLLIKNLALNGIKARIEEPYQRLGKEPIVIIILSLIAFALGKRNARDWQYILEEFEYFFGEQGNMTGLTFLNLQDKINELLCDIKKKSTSISKKSDLKALICIILKAIGKDNLISRYGEYVNIEYLKNVLNEFLNLFWENLQLNNYQLVNALADFAGDNTIPIMTIHKSKGLEFNTVYLIGVEDQAFWNYKNNTEEERRVFFVALSRAINHITFSCCNYRNGGEQTRRNIGELISFVKSKDFVKYHDMTAKS